MEIIINLEEKAAMFNKIKKLNTKLGILLLGLLFVLPNCSVNSKQKYSNLPNGRNNQNQSDIGEYLGVQDIEENQTGFLGTKKEEKSNTPETSDESLTPSKEVPKEVKPDNAPKPPRPEPQDPSPGNEDDASIAKKPNGESLTPPKEVPKDVKPDNVPESPKPEPQEPSTVEENGVSISTKPSDGTEIAKMMSLGDAMVFLYDDDASADTWSPEILMNRSCRGVEDFDACVKYTPKSLEYLWELPMKKLPLNPGIIITDPNEDFKEPESNPELMETPTVTKLIPDTDDNPGGYADFVILTSCHGYPSIVSEVGGNKDIVVLANESETYKRTINYNSLDDLSDFLSLPEIMVNYSSEEQPQPDKDAASAVMTYLNSQGLTLPTKKLTDSSVRFDRIMTTYLCPKKAEGESKRECQSLLKN